MGNTIRRPKYHQHEVKILKTKRLKLDIVRCGVCEGEFRGKRAYGCISCAFFLHPLCTHLWPNFTHPWHPHEMLTLRLSSSFVCAACGRGGTGFHYSCNNTRDCCYDLHPLCALLPDHMQSHHHEHALCRQSKGNFTCKICNLQGSSAHYACARCRGFRVHPYCLTREAAGNRSQLIPYRPSKWSAVGRLLKISARMVIRHTVDIVGVPGFSLFGDGAADVYKLIKVVESMTGNSGEFDTVLTFRSRGNFLTMKWERLPGYGRNDLKRQKVLRELMVMFCMHMKMKSFASISGSRKPIELEVALDPRRR